MKSVATLALFFGVVFTIIGPLAISYSWHLADVESRAMIGELLPFGIDSHKSIEIQCGGFHVNMTLDQLSEGFNLSRYVTLVGFDYPFRITLKDLSFLVSVDMRNTDGEIIAKIVENQWAVNDNHVIAYDRNYNSYAFEVISSDLVPVIQVVFKPQNKMYLGGFFFSPNWTVLLLPNNTSIINPSLTGLNKSLPRIFKYPSQEHLGEMVEPIPYQVSRASTQAFNLGVVLTAIGVPLIVYGTVKTDYVQARVRTYRKSRKHRSRQRKPKKSKDKPTSKTENLSLNSARNNVQSPLSACFAGIFPPRERSGIFFIQSRHYTVRCERLKRAAQHLRLIAALHSQLRSAALTPELRGD
jgi:hypothetical protein